MGSTGVQVKSILRTLHQLVIHGNSNKWEKGIEKLKRNLLLLWKRRVGLSLLLFLILFVKRCHVDIDLHLDWILIPFDYGMVLISFFLIFLLFVFIFFFDIFHIVLQLCYLLFSNLFVSDVRLFGLEPFRVILIPFKVIVILLYRCFFLLFLWFNVRRLLHVKVKKNVRHFHSFAILVYCLIFCLLCCFFFLFLLFWLWDSICIFSLWLLLWCLTLIQVVLLSGFSLLRWFGFLRCFLVIYRYLESGFVHKLASRFTTDLTFKCDDSKFLLIFLITFVGVIIFLLVLSFDHVVISVG